MNTEDKRPKRAGRDLSSLRGTASGGVHLPGDEEYDRARTTWALAVDLRPAAVAFPADAAEVAAVVRAAAAAGLRVAPLGTGHNAHPLGDLSGSVLTRMSGMTGIEIDAGARRARAEAGVLWSAVVDAAAAYGLAALHGSSPDAGVVGYSLGGGVSWYGRSLGLASNSVTAVELVTADGSPTRVDAEHEPELFWAVRGGGGANFGVVTAIEFTLYPIETAYAGMLVWDLRDAHRVLSRWARWAADAPDAVTTSYRHLEYPPIPEIPEPFRGRRLVVVDGAVLADDAEAERILAPLRELGPETDTFGRVPAASLMRLHLDPERPTPGGGRSSLLDELPPAAVDRLIEVAGADSGNSLFMKAELRQLGGALGRSQPGAGATARLDGRFQLITGGMMVGELAERTVADCERVVTAMAPYSRGRQYLNFQEEPVDPSTGYDAPTWEELLRIRKAVDPGGLFQANHEIPHL
ncbi:FAD/FMN-containing dehydrogenase [Streptosporangium lutulentum]|uniref:FAD/FMN-containing dehydrogenase n=2 Tax=Streptosporangium lutulentum TaxID=1461250 RepID=A0ABT9QC79_9ACTN|nr:FAD-binding protein [Streptosporangium lutulentum]MDP9844377.1 FAD/FMN-containing dehydrogenase [Streptosporangium lutulentum]